MIVILLYIQGLEKIMETPWHFKHFNMLFWWWPSSEIQFCAAPFSQFLRKLSLEMIIKICYKFQSCILVILRKNPRKSPIFPNRQLSLPFRVLLLWEGFTFFLKNCHYVIDRTPSYNKKFSGFCYTSACYTTTNNLISFKVLSICHFNEFWLISFDDICKKTTILEKKEKNLW